MTSSSGVKPIFIRAIVLISIAAALLLLRECGAQLYVATENENFRQIREKSKLQCDSMPLHCAAQAEDIAELRKLLNEGVDISSTDNWRMTALHWAAVHGHIESVKVLLDAGADPNTHNENNEPTIVGATRAGHIEIVHALLEAGAPVNPVRSGPQTPLHAAVSTNNLKMVELLLNRGADISAKNALGQSSLDLAITYQYPGPSTSEAIIELLKRGTPQNDPNI